MDLLRALDNIEAALSHSAEQATRVLGDWENHEWKLNLCQTIMAHVEGENAIISQISLLDEKINRLEIGQSSEILKFLREYKEVLKRFDPAHASHLLAQEMTRIETSFYEYFLDSWNAWISSITEYQQKSPESILSQMLEAASKAAQEKAPIVKTKPRVSRLVDEALGIQKLFEHPRELIEGAFELAGFQQITETNETPVSLELLANRLKDPLKGLLASIYDSCTKTPPQTIQESISVIQSAYEKYKQLYMSLWALVVYLYSDFKVTNTEASTYAAEFLLHNLSHLRLKPVIYQDFEAFAATIAPIFDESLHKSTQSYLRTTFGSKNLFPVLQSISHFFGSPSGPILPVIIIQETPDPSIVLSEYPLLTSLVQTVALQLLQTPCLKDVLEKYFWSELADQEYPVFLRILGVLSASESLGNQDKALTKRLLEAAFEFPEIRKSQQSLKVFIQSMSSSSSVEILSTLSTLDYVCSPNIFDKNWRLLCDKLCPGLIKDLSAKCFQKHEEKKSSSPSLVASGLKKKANMI